MSFSIDTDTIRYLVSAFVLCFFMENAFGLFSKEK